MSQIMPNKRRIGSVGKTYAVRQNQLFGPWGPGALLPCPDGASVMIAGLDAFPFSEGADGSKRMLSVYDRRLAKYVGVRRLLAPHIGDVTVPAVRFPRWLYCPSCGRMYYSKPMSQSVITCDNPMCRSKKRRKLVPERFVVVCPEGHIDDFPIVEWVHEGPVTNEHRKEHYITRVTKGGSASLGDVVYKCSCGKKRSLFEASNPSNLEKCGYVCRGSQPWLGLSEEQCSIESSALRVVPRGGTNIWFADVVSSIYIPEAINKGLADCIEENFEDLSETYVEGEKSFDRTVKLISRSTSYTSEEIKNAFADRLNNETQVSNVTEGDYLEAEYTTLKASSHNSSWNDSFEATAVDVGQYTSNIMKGVVEGVTLVSTLKETKALVGFTRLFPDANDCKQFRERRAVLSRKHLDWTLGLQMTGEGIFLSFRKDVFQQWVKRPSVVDRIRKLQQNANRWSEERGDEHRTINPSYVLVHTLSHLLMLELARECGYSAASLKERIYCDRYLAEQDRHDSMLGLLIYTASDDSDGSLGGLVRSGNPGRFERIFDDALRSACWCSCDPVCIESRGQGPGSCNLAACYSCSLVPETSCEYGNKLLDRALLVGTIEAPSVGLVDEILREESSIEFKSKPCDSAASFAENNFVAKTEARPLIHYKVSYAESVDVSDETFSGVCEFVASDATEFELQFLNDLCAIADKRNLEKPIPYVVFYTDSAKAEPSLVWPDSRIVFLLDSSAADFVEAFGSDFALAAEWSILTIEDIGSVEKFASHIEKVDF